MRARLASSSINSLRCRRFPCSSRHRAISEPGALPIGCASHPGEPASIKRIARRVCTSPRTLERIFRNETGMTFGKWRQQLRLLHAMRLLAAGRPVTTVAFEVGYDSPSAFVAMFRRTLGQTPRRYFESADAPPQPEAFASGPTDRATQPPVQKRVKDR